MLTRHGRRTAMAVGALAIAATCSPSGFASSGGGSVRAGELSADLEFRRLRQPERRDVPERVHVVDVTEPRAGRDEIAVGLRHRLRPAETRATLARDLAPGMPVEARANAARILERIAAERGVRIPMQEG